MARVRRGPGQTLVVALAIGGGLGLGAWLVAGALDGAAGRRERAALPDVTLVDATPATLVASGYRFAGRQPASWSAISVREYQDDRGHLLALRCRIAADEVEALLAFPDDSRRPADDLPPADWPWGRDGADDPYRIPDWWRPSGRRARLHEARAGESWQGRYADYDPRAGVLHAWMWRRSDHALVRPDLLASAIADELAMGLGDQARAVARPAADGSFHLPGVDPGACGVPPSRLPAGITRIDAWLLPARGAHRYLIAVQGLDLAAARALVGEVPLAGLPADAPPPVAAWAFALPVIGGVTGLPDWFRPGPGPRWTHCLVALGDGTVRRGRWVAYDPALRTVFCWDWEGPGAQPAAADLQSAARPAADG